MVCKPFQRAKIAVITFAEQVCLTYRVSIMAQRHISGRQLRHGSPEESLAPGQSVIIKKRGGKEFRLTRTDTGKRNITAEIDQLFRDIPPDGPRTATDLVRLLRQERE
jgi:hypothetical protein